MKQPMLNLKEKIINSLEIQGFIIRKNKLTLNHQKDSLRKVQLKSREEKIKKHIKFLSAQNGSVKQYIIDGKDINPEKIRLELRVVNANSNEEIIYKWWNLVWWSIPYERAYGRQLRFILWDTYHDKPFGLIGLHSAPLKMKIRDDYLGICKENRDWWVNMSLSAQRVGALPPYNQLLGGKMVAMALAAEEIRTIYRDKYQGRLSLIRNRELPAELLFITTTGAFGKSSIYNRVKYKEDPLIYFLGYTQGSGAFHITEELYQELLLFLRQRGIDTSRGYGHGPSRKRQLLTQAFKLLNLPSYEYHGIKRAFYLIPQVRNLQKVISHFHIPEYKNYTINELTEFWKERWAIPRSLRIDDWKSFKAQDFWQKKQNEIKNILNSLN